MFDAYLTAPFCPAGKATRVGGEPGVTRAVMSRIQVGPRLLGPGLCTHRWASPTPVLSLSLFLLSACHMPGPAPASTDLWGGHTCPCFQLSKQAHGSSVTCPRSHSSQARAEWCSSSQPQLSVTSHPLPPGRGRRGCGEALLGVACRRGPQAGGLVGGAAGGFLRVSPLPSACRCVNGR